MFCWSSSKFCCKAISSISNFFSLSFRRVSLLSNSPSSDSFYNNSPYSVYFYRLSLNLIFLSAFTNSAFLFSFFIAFSRSISFLYFVILMILLSCSFAANSTSCYFSNSLYKILPVFILERTSYCLISMLESIWAVSLSFFLILSASAFFVSENIDIYTSCSSSFSCKTLTDLSCSCCSFALKRDRKLHSFWSISCFFWASVSSPEEDFRISISWPICSLFALILWYSKFFL